MSFSIRAQVAEPILTKSAVPFGAGAGSVKLDYAGGIGQGGGASQIIPEGKVEMGVRDGLEVLARLPLLRVNLQSPGGRRSASYRPLSLSGAATRPPVERKWQPCRR